MAGNKVVVGTRGSRLALIQTDLVVQALKAKHPELDISIKVIVTKGDKNHAPIPLDTIGKAWFTQEIEDALLHNEIDLAIHSLKDLPPQVPEGLRITPIMQRDDPRDVLVAKTATSLADLPRGAVVGTDSIRRKAQVLYRRPDLIVKSVRGNVDTRLQKAESAEYDAVILAAAGLSRLGSINRVTQFFTVEEFVPAVGQAVLAAEVRRDDSEIWKLLSSIQDRVTLAACRAERAFSEVIGGGCKLPVGCYVEIRGNTATIYGMVGSMDAKNTIIKVVRGMDVDAIKLAKGLAMELLDEPVRLGW